MAYSQLDASNANGNLNTGNISTDDFLAIFSTITTSVNANDTITKALYAGKGGGDFSSNNISSSINNSNNNNVTLNPPLLKVDGQYTLTNVLESSLAGVVTTLNPNYINDSFFYWNGNFFNNSVSGGGSGGSGSGTTSTSNTSGSGGSPGQFNYNQTLLAANNTSSNVTEFYWDGRYPSGYTLTQIVITSIIVTILMIIIVVGNMLVIIAIATEKSLKNIQNWFIASLAVADFFLGLVIMPFSLANELMGYWVFGSWWCDIHSAMDVLLCTASIMNLCLISLDRYWSITKAVDYLKSRTPARAVVMIAAVWIMSALICIPPLLGWKVKLPEGPLPKCAVR